MHIAAARISVATVISEWMGTKVGAMLTILPSTIVVALAISYTWSFGLYLAVKRWVE